MKTKAEIMKVYTVGFDFEKMAIKTEVVEFEKENNNLKNYYNIIGCDTIDIVNLNEDIAIVVDDDGLLKSGTPVFEIKTEDGAELQLAGKLLFAKNNYTNDGTKLTGLTSGEIFNLMINLEIRVIGVTR